MPTTAEAIRSLKRPTPAGEIKKRPIFNKQKQKIGELDYVDARYVYDVLDETVGPENWQSKTREVSGGVVGAIGILIQREGDHGEWVWKEDVGTESTIEPVKGTYSDAIKRAAVHWGIARDLYESRSGDRRVKPVEGRSSTETRAATNAPRNFKVPKSEAPWVCPDHDAVVAWPAGVSAAGRRYEAFYACPEGRSCPHRPPHGLKVKPEHLKVSDMDSLPF